MNIIELLADSLRESAEYNQNSQAAPAAVLWTDKECQWQKAVHGIQLLMPELLVLGEYNPEQLTGPAIWLKCAIAGTLDNVRLPEKKTPIIYLPGVSRSDLRAIESCPPFLQPLAELQYRGVFWSQGNGRDWTVFAWLKTTNGGLGLDIAKDDSTLTALQRALPYLLSTDIRELQNKRVEATDVNQLLTIEAVKDLLIWMNDPKGTRELWDEARWCAFEETVQKDFALSATQEGELGAAEKLAAQSGNWQKVWDRFEESWQNYPQLVELLERVSPTSDMFADRSGYLRYNAEQEQQLKDALKHLEMRSPAEARSQIKKLEEQHGMRREWVWATMGRSPLACALRHLVTLAEKSDRQLGGMTLEGMAQAYSTDAWQVDCAAMEALAVRGGSDDLAAVESALKSLYTPWLSDCAEHFQRLVAQEDYASVRSVKEPSTAYSAGGECIFFVDGLRFDAAKKLERMLVGKSLQVELISRWAALPTVTATAKASVTPVADVITGRVTDRDFVPSLIEKESSWSQHYLKKYLVERGWQFLASGETGDSKGLAWLETGDLDHYGHEHGLKLARNMEQLLSEIEERVVELLAAGWQKIRIVTDHGWLLVPGGLPKASLPKHLSETRWGRCALLKEGVTTDMLTVGWHWNPSVSVAMAPGIASFVGGKVYEHGGLTLQECLIPVLSISSDQQRAAASAEIVSVKWQGLRCKVEVATDSDGICAQIRVRLCSAK